jgi:hypothetical protein
MKPSLYRIALVALALFAATSLQRFWVHPSGEHTWRQSVTIGMSMMFADELRTRGIDGLDFLLYPKIIDHRLLDGINASEFPLLNAITGPLFLIGSPWAGVFLSSVLLLLINIFCAYRSLPKLLRLWDIQISGVTALLLWFSARTIAYQSNVIMPEGLAFPLMIVGLPFLVDKKWQKNLIGILFCSLGIAVKPVVVIMLGAIPTLWIKKANRKHFTHWSLTVLTTLLFPAYWYGVHAKYILSFAQGPQIFQLAHFTPFENLRQISPLKFLKLLGRESLWKQFPMLLGWAWLGIALWFGEWLWVLLYFTALIAIMALDGIHVAVHGYYFIGVSLFSILISARVLKKSEKKPRLKLALILTLVWGVLYNSWINIASMREATELKHTEQWTLGQIARAMIPPSYRLVTDDPDYPEKLVFIGRGGEIAGPDAINFCNKAEYKRIPFAIVTEAHNLLPSQSCPGRILRIKSARVHDKKWNFFLVQ